MFARVALCLTTALSVMSCAPVAMPESHEAVSFVQWQRQCADAGSDRAAWTAPAPPYHVFGNTYGVGTCGISALLIVSPEGHVLLDTGMPKAAPLIAANIERLGFDLADVKWLLSSHEHIDHVGATADLKRRTGARVAALAAARRPLETGLPYPHDPQASIIPPFEGFAVDRVLADGETLHLGAIAITAHATPAHTPGSTSWTWRACEGATCRTIAYVDSLTTPAADEYRFADHPDYVAALRHGFEAVARLPCDIVLTPHPGASAMVERLAGDLPLVDPTGCRAYARQAVERFEARLAAERAEGS